MMRHDESGVLFRAEADRLKGTVSWFSPVKGFGFVKPDDGSEDVFIHASVVQQAGMVSLREGCGVTCEVAAGKKGRQAIALLSVDESTANLSAVRERPRDARPLTPLEGEVFEGVVKWFNAAKGFGFITPDRGGKDVFLHASILRRAGLQEVQPGQRVLYSAVNRDKGPEACSLRVNEAVG